MFQQRGWVKTRFCSIFPFFWAKTKNDQDTLKHKINTLIFFHLWGGYGLPGPWDLENFHRKSENDV